MTQKKTIEPAGWADFLNEFSGRNRGRRARFEIFTAGNSAEEVQEGKFESVSLNERVATVVRSYESAGERKTMSDDISDVHGIEVQLDTDGSEDVLSFFDHSGNMASLHFESKVDGDS